MGAAATNGVVSGAGGGNYLQTIESEEVLGTEGYDNNNSMIGNPILEINSSALVTQNNIDDTYSRKSFI